MVLNAENKLKVACLDELGTGWLKQIICNGTEDLRDSQPPSSMHTPNAAGMQVDLLNAVDTSSATPLNTDEDSEGDVRMSDTEPLQKGRSASLNGHSTPSTIDDMAIQKEALEFIRNLTCGDRATEMIDHLFGELGQDKLFEMLASKLRVKVHNAYGRRSGSGGVPSKPSPTNRYNQASAEIISSVTYILVHIAAGNPRHRQILISQTELLRLILPLFSHQNREIRVNCAWVVINLIWVDDNSDQGAAKARARELAQLGFMERCKILEGDIDLDARERARTAVHTMGDLLRRP